MEEVIEVVFRDGVFKPLKKIDLPNDTRGKVIIERKKVSNVEYFEKIVEELTKEIEIKEDPLKILLENRKRLWDLP